MSGDSKLIQMFDSNSINHLKVKEVLQNYVVRCGDHFKNMGLI